MWKILIILVSTLSIIRTECPANYQLSQFQANSISFYLSRAHEGQDMLATFEKSLAKDFNSPPSISISINELQYSGVQNDSIQSFRVFSHISESSIIFKFEAKSRKWTKLNIKYWASSRSDTIVGQKSLSFQNIQNNQHEEIQIENIGLSYKKAIVRMFINGLKVGNSSELQVHIEGRNKRQNAILLQISVGEKTKLQTLWFSYVIIIASLNSLDSFGGIVMKKSFQGIHQESIRNDNNLHGFYLMGVTKIKMKNQLSFSAEIDSDYVFSHEISGKSVSLGISYIFLGVKSINLCSECDQQVYFSEECVEKCPYPSYLSQNKNFSYCKKCSQKLNEVLNSQKTGCQCVQGYILQSSKCVKVEQVQDAKTKKVYNFFLPLLNSKNKNTLQQDRGKKSRKNHIISQNCIFFPNTFWTGQECVCKNEYVLNEKTGFCEEKIDECSAQSFNEKSCVCIPKNKKNQKKNCGQNLCSDIVCDRILNENCGNGVIDEGEYCDDGNILNSDGCSSICRVQNNSGCFYGPPSICYRASYNLRLLKQIAIEKQSIHIEIETYPSFSFENEKQMKNFLQFSFKNSLYEPQNIECSQRRQRQNAFNCILSYPKGIPEQIFKIQVHFQKSGKKGYTALIIDPTTSKYFRRRSK